MEIYTAFLIGLMGSFHCIGMCGPIMIALPVGNKSLPRFILNRVTYHLGRVFTYTIMGLIIGLISSRLMMFQFQKVSSIVMGVIILLVVLIPFKFKNKLYGHKYVQMFYAPIKNAMSGMFKKQSVSAQFVLGLLTGLLPCGLVYAAIATALAAADIVNSTLAMIAFGVGTIPLTLLFSMTGKLLSVNIRNKIHKAIPGFAVILAVIFILRGMSLGIPFISPKNPAEKPAEPIKKEMIKPSVKHDCCS